MKYASKPLRTFIQDFRLTNPAGADCFNATINFIAGGANIKIESEVHIVTSYPDNSGIIYLLNRDINVNELPTMFEADKESFEYIAYKNLRIEGTHHKAGDYIVFISPENTVVTY
jgi:hypothetical protein